MTNPVYKIETWTGGVKDHTITDEARSLQFKEVLTYGVGTFSFTVPTVKGKPDPYYYDDITKDDTVKIWLDYDSVSGNPDFVGKVTKVSGRLSIQEGYVRQISGLSQGEIMLRKHKKNKLWSGIGASTIVTGIAGSLGLGAGSIEADATAETIEVNTERFFDVLQRVSDYYDGGGSVQKDFYVNVANDLVWCSRDGTAPFRSGASVESLTIGDNILSYDVIRDAMPVKNNIVVYGGPYNRPPGSDDWCETLANWTSDDTLALSGTRVVGEYSISGFTAVANNVYAQRTNTACRCGWRDQRYMNFYYYCVHGGGGAATAQLTVSLLAPIWADRFEKVFTGITQSVWFHKDLELGPHGNWSSVGSPGWADIRGARFKEFGGAGAGSAQVLIDEFHYTGGHYYGAASSGAADRDFELTDDKLTTNAECVQRAETIALRKETLPIQIAVVIAGNPNVLVGDRLSMTIPAEGISAANYDVISVGQLLSVDGGYLTTATMMNSANVRQPLKTNIADLIVEARNHMQALSRSEQRI